MSSDLGARNAALKLGGEGAAPLPAPDPPPSPRPQSRRSLRIPTRRRAHWLVASKLASGNLTCARRCEADGDFADFAGGADFLSTSLTLSTSSTLPTLRRQGVVRRKRRHCKRRHRERDRRIVRAAKMATRLFVDFADFVNFVDFADFGDSADSADCSPAGDSRPADSPPTLPT